ncbi:hypothetical protein N2152v2_010333 [Parachlorella kessleri]
MESVSKRSHKLMKPALPYIPVLLKAMQDPWSDGNPEGWIPLAVAENKLSNQEVLERLEAVKDYPTWVMNYAGIKGVPPLQQALAGLMERTFVRDVRINSEHVCLSVGCSAIIDNLFFVLGDEGDGVLIPAPYYPAFDNDLKAKNHLQPLPFYLKEEEPISPQIDQAVADAATRGITVKALLVTNPNNPLGIIYSDDTVKAMLAWCLEHKVHYVSDEIYALSVYKPGPQPFVSALTLAQQLVARHSTAKAPLGAAADGHPSSPSPPSSSEAAAGGAGGAEAGSAAGASAAAAAAAAAVPGEAAAEAVGGLSRGTQPNGGGGGAGARSASSAPGGSEERSQGASAQAGAAPAPATDGSSSGAASFSQQDVNAYVHLIYGLSKDWCASGLRVGLLYSRNETLQQALNSIAIFAGIPNPIQHALAQVLSDAEWVEAFVQRNCRLLETSYDILAGKRLAHTRALSEAAIPFLPAVGGMFVWVDLRQWLPSPTWEGEEQLWSDLCNKSKVMFTPGQPCHAQEPGFFRLCFAWMPPQALSVAVQRLGKQLKEIGAAASAQ